MEHHDHCHEHGEHCGCEEKVGLQYPCPFPFKVIAKTEEGIEAYITEILNEAIPELTREMITSRGSRTGKYVSMTINITAQSEDHVAQIAAILKKDPKVMASF